MAKTGWGRPTIKLGDPDTTGKTIPAQNLQILLNAKDNSVKLEVTEGEKKELKGEGGVVLDVRRSASTASLELEVFVLKDDPLPAKLKSDTASVVIVPEDSSTVGLFIPMARVSLAEQWSTDEGASYKVRFEPLKAKDADDIRPYYFTKAGVIYDPLTASK